MAPPDAAKLRENLGRRLANRKGPRKVSMDIPERLKEEEDEQDDATATHMNQSIFAMVSAASRASQTDFQSRFDEASSESESENSEQLSRTTPAIGSLPPAPITQEPKPKHKRDSSVGRLFKSMHKGFTPRKSRSSSKDMMSSSQILAPRPPPHIEVDEEESQQDAAQSSGAPMMSRILMGEAEMAMSQHLQPVSEQEDGESASVPKLGSGDLEQRLMDIFNHEEREAIIGEYPCCLLSSVLVQGHLYLTQKHVCFYAYLPKKAAKIALSGHLAKRGLHNPRYNRYYCELKGDVFAYYDNPSTRYFPSGQIDLRAGVSANIADREKNKDGAYFTLVTDKREYMFKADTTTSAREWVKALQKVIFRAHNDGDSVKVSLPIDHIMDIEEVKILDVAQTIKIRVYDNDETYSIDEYFFSFFMLGEEAMRVLKILVEDNALHKCPESDMPTDSDVNEFAAPDSVRPSLNVERTSMASQRTPPLRDTVRATLLPYASVPGQRALSNSRLSTESRRSSMEIRRRSYDSRNSSDGRQSISLSRQFDRSPLSPTSPAPQESLGSPRTTSMDRDTESSAAIQSLDETDASASQILNRSDVFQAPTLHPPQRSGSVDQGQRVSSDTARSTRVSQVPHTSSEQGRNKLQKQRPGPTPINTVQPTLSEQDMTAGSSYSFQNLVRAGTSPLQSAGALGNFLRTRSKRMSNLLASESMGYYEKVSGMWAGGGQHYGQTDGMPDDDDIPGGNENKEERDAMHAQRFREHFALPDSEELKATWYCFLHRVLPLYGKIYLGSTFVCFRPLLPGVRLKLKLPLSDIENVTKEMGYRLGYSGMVVAIRGHEEIFFDFREQSHRDDCNITILKKAEAIKKRRLKESGFLNEEELIAAETARAEHKALQEARKSGQLMGDHEVELPHHLSYIGTDPVLSLLDIADMLSEASETRGIFVDDPRADLAKSPKPMQITCLTIGSRGDVQPYIALAKRLMKDGHKVRIATHDEFKDWVEGHGVDFAPVAGDPAKLMRICVEHGMFTFSFMREATGHFREWLEGLMATAWEGCQGSDLIIESPSAMVGIHIAEALEVPYYRAFTMPWTKTRAYPHAFAVPEIKRGGNYNYLTYVMIENVFWKATANQMNKWRRRSLGLGNTSLGRMQPNKIPFLYNFSPFVVPPPLDFSDWIRITGYWFLDEEDWTPPPQFAKLKAFIKKARDDSKRLVYIGFGSVVVDNPKAMTEAIVEGVEQAGVRCILSKGWSDRLSKEPTDGTIPEVPLPASIMQITYSVPHAWLFAQVDAAVHHGGAGTTGASLRAGIPTIIKPFFGDQFFFGARVEDLGVGICMRKLQGPMLAKTLREATHDQRMIDKASLLGEQIRGEDGVGQAVRAIYRDLDYAKSLIKRKTKDSKTGCVELEEDIEETWTFVGEESDTEERKQTEGGNFTGGDGVMESSLEEMIQESSVLSEERDETVPFEGFDEGDAAAAATSSPIPISAKVKGKMKA
ncbi:26S protease regulatory subunit [Venturia nashicola]|nr:26S protease regulatory subunit [Venturia nashicola]